MNVNIIKLLSKSVCDISLSPFIKFIKNVLIVVKNLILNSAFSNPNHG